MKKIALQKSEISEYITKQFSNTDITFTLFDSYAEIHNSKHDLIILYDGCNTEIKDCKTQIINIHPSLLPAFENDCAVKDIFNSGVKVSGITIYRMNDKKIITQYPILIGLETHIDDYIKEVNNIAKILLPVVIEAIFTDKVFDFPDLFKRKTCSHGGCSNCNKCHKQ